MKFHATTDSKGKLNLVGSKEWVRFKLSQLSPNSEYTIDITQGRKRSSNQNAYYWSVVVTLVYQGLRDAGYDDIRNEEDAHDVLKEMFFKRVIFSNQSGELAMVRSTTRYTKKEFEEKLEAIRMWAYDFLGITIPLPNTQTALDI